MPEFVSTLTIWVVAMLTWVIVMMGVAQLSRFYKNFQDYKRENEANLLGLAGQLKKLQTTLSEQLLEQRRMSKLLLEQLELKRAEMTGDFEIVEEEVSAAPAPAPAPAAPPEAEAPTLLDKRPPAQFPKIV